MSKTDPDRRRLPHHARHAPVWPSRTPATAWCRPRTASTGSRFSRAKQADVIITDINMPRMDGFGFIEDVRRDTDATAAMPILVLTTESDAEKKNRARNGRRHRLDRQAVQPGQAGRRRPPRRRLILRATPMAPSDMDAHPTRSSSRSARNSSPSWNPGLLAMEGGDSRSGDRQRRLPRGALDQGRRRRVRARGRWCASRTSSRRCSTRCAPAAWRTAPRRRSRRMLRAADVLADLVRAARDGGERRRRAHRPALSGRAR